MADFAQTNCYQYLKLDTKCDSQLKLKLEKNKSQQQMAVRLAQNHKLVLRFLRKAENFSVTQAYCSSTGTRSTNLWQLLNTEVNLAPL